MNLSDFMDAYVTNLIRDHTRLCKRFAKAQQYFDNPNIAKSEKIHQEENILELFRQLNTSVSLLKQSGYIFKDNEIIEGIKL